MNRREENRHVTTMWECYFADRSVENRNRLVEWYLPMVETEEARARKMYKIPFRIERDELISAASLRLIKAIDRCKQEKIRKPGAWVRLQVRHEMIDEMRRSGFEPHAQLPVDCEPEEEDGNRVVAGATERMVAPRRMTPSGKGRFWNAVKDVLTMREVTLIYLLCVAKLTLREAGKAMTITEGRASQLQAQALERIRSTMGDQISELYQHGPVSGRGVEAAE